MSTRSYIGKRLPNGDITAIYCHWDGYPEHHGRILTQHYTDTAKVDRLLKLGALSQLGPEIGKKHDFNKPTEGWCLAYARDRGEKRQGAFTVSELGDLTDDVDYVYVWDGAEWHCYDDGKLIDLAMESAA